MYVKSHTKSGVSCGAQTTSDYDFTITISGYNFLGCTGVQIDMGGTLAIQYISLITSNTVRVRLLNTGSSAITPSNVILNCLYVKQ